MSDFCEPYGDEDSDYSYVMKNFNKVDLYDRLYDWDRSELVELLLEFVWKAKGLEK